MAAPIIQTDEWNPNNYDLIIDVRSPCEFEEDHIPGAKNMPVLFDNERIIIGKIYKQKSKFLARKKGAVIAARNISYHIERELNGKDQHFRPLIHCWRGGQRSRAFAQVCSEIGWRTFVLTGGYKTYRRAVLEGLDDISKRLKFIVIAGRTGSAKTKILSELSSEGAQVLDLENLAAHRGSLLGKINTRKQPQQRLFESILYSKLNEFNCQKPVYVESESSRIGEIQLPSCIWKKIISAPMIAIQTPLISRVQYLLAEYESLKEDLATLKSLVNGMTYRHGHARVNFWQQLIDSKKWDILVTDLLRSHYDPAYDKSIQSRDRLLLGRINQNNCLTLNLKKTVNKILHIDEK